MPSIIMWCKHVNVFQMPSTILHLPNASQPSTSSNLLLPSHTLRRSSSHTWSMPSKDWFKKQRAFDSLLHDSDHLVLSAHLWTAPVELFFLLSPHQPVAPTSHLSFYHRDLNMMIKRETCCYTPRPHLWWRWPAPAPRPTHKIPSWKSAIFNSFCNYDLNWALCVKNTNFDTIFSACFDLIYSSPCPGFNGVQVQQKFYLHCPYVNLIMSTCTMLQCT